MKHFFLFLFGLSFLNLNAQLIDITPDDLQKGDFFGFSMEINGNEAIISAEYADYRNIKKFGAIHYYKFDGIEWQKNQTILPSIELDGHASNFGSPLALTDNWVASSVTVGNQLIAVILFKRENDNWVRHSVIIDSTTDDSNFGWDFTFDGDRLAISAVAGPDPNFKGANIVYLYEYNPNSDTWELDVAFTSGETRDDDFFGSSIYLKNDLLAIGARDDNDNGSECGAVYVFEKDQNGWKETAKLIPDDANASDHIGYKVDGDGNRLIISGTGHKRETGSVYIFKKEAEWVQEGRLIGADVGKGNWFGSSVAIEGDRAIVGARYHSKSKGAVYVFEKENKNWVEKIKIENPTETKDQFGTGLDYENGRLIIGAPFINKNHGAAYTYTFEEILSVSDQLDLTIFLNAHNPNQNETVVNAEHQQIQELEIYTSKGELVKSFKNDDLVKDISELASGIYVVKQKSDQAVLGKFEKI